MLSKDMLCTEDEGGWSSPHLTTCTEQGACSTQ